MFIKQIKVGKKMYDVISQGDNNTVIKWEDNTVAKLFELGNKQAQKELELLGIANQINNLLVKAIEIKYSSCYKYEMLIMERLVILDKRSLSLSERKSFLSIFQTQLNQLNKNRFIHGDIKRPLTHKKGDIWDNVCVTPQGIRLIDVGCSILDYNSRIDSKDAEEFGEYFLK